MATSEPASAYLDDIDFTPEETWRLLRWCADQGAEEFSVDFHELADERHNDPLKAFLLPRAGREHYRYASDGFQDTTLYRLNEASIRAFQRVFPSGLFQAPSYASTEPWAEDPVVYRQGQLMLAIVSHEGFGELRISKREEDLLARLGLRGGYLESEQPCTSLSIGPVTISILPHEFPCLSGGPEDDWLRVHFKIESIPRVFVGYKTLNTTLGTIDSWRRRMDALLARTANEVTLETDRPGFSLRMTRPSAGSSISVVVDGRQMWDLVGHMWTFSVEEADVARLCGECATALREHDRPDVRPQASVPNDLERAIRAGRRFLLVA